jgi:uncharacterized protein (TIGR02302 family)
MSTPQTDVLKKLVWPLRLTLWGLRAEALSRAFWPLWSVLIAGLAALMLGMHDLLAVEVVWAAGVVWALGLVLASVWGFRHLRWPSRGEALERLDATMPGRPITALLDDQAIGAGDAASVAVWRAHQARMAARVADAKAVEPDLRLSRQDPFALRYVALAALAVAVLFGSVGRISSVAGMAPGQSDALVAGPSWEGWIAPPNYTGLPVLYMADLGPEVQVPEGAVVTLRFYGEVGALTLSETVSGRVEVPAASDLAHEFTVTQAGRIEVMGKNGRSWAIAFAPDAKPVINATGAATASADGVMSLPFAASDDYGVVAGQARIELDLAAVDRRYGLALEPEPREAVTVALPLPIAGSRADFKDTLVEDFSEHPWANLPVRVTLSATDALEQVGESPALEMPLRARRFFDPLAGAIIEMRRDLLWSRQNAPRVAQLLRAISHRPGEGVFKRETDYLRLRGIMRRLEGYQAYGLSEEQRDEVAKAMWDFAIELEEGDIDTALTRMREAHERLNEAMKNGASEQEIARLMQELRDATDDYLRQLAQQARRDAENNPDQDMAENNLADPNAMQMTQNDLQKMMDEIQKLMEEGRMAEAQQALEELQRMMENMRVTQGQNGQGPQSPGEQAMEGLADTLRQQQGLSDQAFRDLQEQFNPEANRGESQGNEGRNGGQGRGQSHEGQGAEGQEQGQGEGQAGEPGQEAGEDARGSLTERQEALRRELNRQRGNLPGAGTEAGETAREALGRAEGAMEGAEEALRRDDLAEAIDRQAEAMEALRDGIRNLGRAMAEDRQQNRGQTGQAMGQPEGQQRDPLGRRSGANGQATGTDDALLQGEDVYRRAQELLDQIRRRSGEAERPAEELDYLKRLLERF